MSGQFCCMGVRRGQFLTRNLSKAHETRPIGTLIHIGHRRVWRWGRWRLLVNDKDLRSLISRKKSVKNPILAFKVIKGH